MGTTLIISDIRVPEDGTKTPPKKKKGKKKKDPVSLMLDPLAETDEKSLPQESASSQKKNFNQMQS